MTRKAFSWLLTSAASLMTIDGLLVRCRSGSRLIRLRRSPHLVPLRQ